MRIAVFAVASAMFACSDPNELDLQRQPIIGGAATLSGQFPTVVAVSEPAASVTCSGTLIAPTVVITAAQCVDPDLLGRTVDEITAETVVMLDTLDVTAPGVVIHPAQIIENPSHPDFTLGDFGHDDDALIVLATPVTDRVTTPVDLAATTKLGTKATHVGYGIHTIGTNHTGVEFYLTDRPVVGCAFAQSGLLDDRVLCFDEAIGKGPCGDAGASVQDQDGHLIGIGSFNDSVVFEGGLVACNVFGADTRPSQTADFILANVPELAAGSCGMDGVCNLSCASDPDCVPVAPYCGDGIVQANEQCDVGSSNGTIGSGCSTQCTPVAPVCGNMVVEAGEDCDLGSMNGVRNHLCTADCKFMLPEQSGCAASGSPLGIGGILLAGLGIMAARRRR